MGVGWGRMKQVKLADNQKVCKKLLDENRRLREALQSILDSMEQMPQLNESIVEEVMRGDHTLECEIGGDEASISAWVAAARMALLPSESVPGRI